MASDATTVNVKNISTETSEGQVKDFFSFCGKISHLSLSKDGSTQSAKVTFEKPTAAKTAMLLDSTQLGPSVVQVSSPSSSTSATSDDAKSGAGTSATDTSSLDHVEQEDKPRARILAEYLASGYTVSDKAIERAIALDKQHGFSSRFTSALRNFDDKYKAVEKAQGLDTKYGVTEKAGAGLQGINSYFERALGTPTGQRIRAFYQDGSKQVMDVHTEARRLADLKTGKQEQHGGAANTPNPTPATASAPAPSYGGANIPAGTSQVPGTDKTKCDCGSDIGACPCEPGKCACASCPKNSGSSGDTATGDPGLIEKMGMQKVDGTSDRTKCNCAGDGGSCPCEPGKCMCGDCGKNPDVGVKA
ncbi:MAG: hypothetical protein M1831_000864 [Alyxoria varia]|nr:MAG: hypothetical protein M1831_000864 [Alyxoria varia]